jgi:hypothetical protein
MRTMIRHQFLAVLVLCLSAACASARGDGQKGTRIVEDVGTVQVQNDGHDDFMLYMFRDNARYRLGRVSRMQTARFNIPPAAVGDLPSYQVQLVAEPIGLAGRSFATGPISWRPGQNLAGRVSRNNLSEQFLLVTR